MNSTSETRVTGHRGRSVFLTDGDFATRQKKQRRQKRPRQLAPGNRTAGRDNEDGATVSRRGSGDYSEPAQGESQVGRDYARRVSDYAMEFNKRRGENRRQFIKNFPHMRAFRKAMSDAHAQAMQDAVDSALDMEKRNHRCSMTGVESLCLKKIRNVVCYGLGFRCVLTVEIYGCSRCTQSVTVHPLQVCCTPTSPTDNCETWLSLDFCLVFRDLHLHNGLSADAFVHMARNLETYYDPDGMPLIAADGTRLNVSEELRPSQLSSAVTEFSKFEVSVSTLSSESTLSSDPWIHCPACAVTDRTSLNDGVTPVLDVPFSVCTDAINSANRFASAGRSQRLIKPTTDLYLGALADQIRTDFATGHLRNMAQERMQEAGLEDANDGLIMSCTTALTCNRPVASATRGELDQYGMVSVVCPHVIPGLGLSVPMLTYEQHYYYDVVLGNALRRRPDLRVMYLDLACRYNKRWRLQVKKSVEDGFITEEMQEKVQLLLPWMHAFDHDHECQLKFSALYQDGVARRVGEQTEALWSITKPFFKIARYMTPAHWQDNTNQLLWQLTLRKQRRFPVMLEGKLKRIFEKIGRCRSDLAALEHEAERHGVRDLSAALEALEKGTLSGVHSELSLKARYVEVLLKLRSHNSMAKEKAVLPLLLPGKTGIHVHRKGGDEDTRRKLVNIRNRLAGLLMLNVDEVWGEDSTEYKEGLQELAGAVIRKYQKRVEEQVFKQKLILQNLQQSYSGKNAQKLRKSLEATKKNIVELLSVLETWNALKDERSENAVSDDKVRAVSKGEFPWVRLDLGENGSPVVQRHFAQRYRTARCQLQRSQEEKIFLRNEAVRLINWTEERSQELISKRARHEQKILKLQASLQGQISEVIPDVRQPNIYKSMSEIKDELEYLNGYTELLVRDEAWTTSIFRDAQRRLLKYVRMDHT